MIESNNTNKIKLHFTRIPKFHWLSRMRPSLIARENHSNPPDADRIVCTAYWGAGVADETPHSESRRGTGA